MLCAGDEHGIEFQPDDTFRARYRHAFRAGPDVRTIRPTGVYRDAVQRVEGVLKMHCPVRLRQDDRYRPLLPPGPQPQLADPLNDGVEFRFGIPRLEESRRDALSGMPAEWR